jgi:hypothetical protein
MKPLQYFSVLFLAMIFSLTIQAELSVNIHDVLKDDHLDSEHQHYEKEEHDILKKRISLLENGETYACNLQQKNFQCREYSIITEERSKLIDLAASCESMSDGSFSKGHCPKKDRLSQCQKIVLNNHDVNTLIYTNNYYSGKNSPWSIPLVQRICVDLNGHLVKN